jgi:hypothetical protein
VALQKLLKAKEGRELHLRYAATPESLSGRTPGGNNT